LGRNTARAWIISVWELSKLHPAYKNGDRIDIRNEESDFTMLYSYHHVTLKIEFWLREIKVILIID